MAGIMPATGGASVPANFDVDYTKGLQKALNEKAGITPALVPDGSFGPKSVSALQQYQQKVGIPATGLYDSATQALLDPFITTKYLQTPDFNQAAANIGVSPSVVRTVCQVETSGSGFLPDGRCVILFERHIFLKQLQVAGFTGQQIAQLQAQGNSDIINATPGGYAGGAGEYPRFNRAFAINPKAAMGACSWGLFQIMGFHFDWAGYQDIDTFVTDMRTSEDKQLEAFVNFVKITSGGQLQRLLKAKDWLNFARQYNGVNEANSNPPYHTRLANAYNQLFPVYG
jgi:peptidoglycan hydrolase-like protein with peptidoglycan-binding domain